MESPKKFHSKLSTEKLQPGGRKLLEMIAGGRSLSAVADPDRPHGEKVRRSDTAAHGDTVNCTKTANPAAQHDVKIHGDTVNGITTAITPDTTNTATTMAHRPPVCAAAQNHRDVNRFSGTILIAR